MHSWNQGFFLIVRLSSPSICKHKTLKLFHEFHKVTEAAAQRCSIKKCFLNNFAKLTRKSLFQSLFLIELQATACNFFKREALAQLFYCKFSENLKNIFLLSNTSIAFFGVKNWFLEIADLKIQRLKKNETVKKKDFSESFITDGKLHRPITIGLLETHVLAITS